MKNPVCANDNDELPFITLRAATQNVLALLNPKKNETTDRERERNGACEGDSFPRAKLTMR